MVEGARKCLVNDDGSVAVEFALISVLLLSLLLAIVESGLCFLFSLSMEGFTERLARMIQTGQVQRSGVSSVSDLKMKVICPPAGGGLLPSFVDCSRLFVDVRSAGSYAMDTSLSFYKNPAVYCVSAAGQNLVVRVAYAMPVFFPGMVLSNAVFEPSTAGLVDDFPNTTGWSHLLASGMILQVEDGGSQESTNSAQPSGSATSATCP